MSPFPNKPLVDNYNIIWCFFIFNLIISLAMSLSCTAKQGNPNSRDPTFFMFTQLSSNSFNKSFCKWSWFWFIRCRNDLSMCPFVTLLQSSRLESKSIWSSISFKSFIIDEIVMFAFTYILKIDFSIEMLYLQIGHYQFTLCWIQLSKHPQ